MHQPKQDMVHSKSLGQFLLKAWKESHRRRPTSFYLMLAMLAVVLLGVQYVFVQDDPKRFAFFLSLNFIFFFVVIYRAIVDAIDISRKNFRQREDLFRETIGEEKFVAELAKHSADAEQAPQEGEG